MKILHDLILIQPKEDKKAILILPKDSTEMPQEGTVINQGPEVPENLKGKTVVFRKWLGDLMNYEEKEYVIVKYEDILIII